MAADTPLIKSLALDHWDESRFATFADGQALSVDEQLEVDRLAQRLAGLDRRVFYATQAEPVTVQQLSSDPEKYRGKFIRLAGTAIQSIGRSTAPRRPQDPQSAYTCVVRDDTGEALVMSAAIPKTWQAIHVEAEPLAVEGLFVKVVKAEDNAISRPLLAAPQIAWFPQAWKPPAVNYGMSVLGIMGVDVALLDRVQHRKPLQSGETASFYRLLAGLEATTGNQLVHWAQRHLPRHRAEWKDRAQSAIADQAALAGEVLRVADDKQYSVAPFFNMPAEQVGQLAVFDGVVRRAIRIEVADDLDAKAAGIDHYFELALFTDDAQNNPIIFAVLEVPPDLPLGDDVRVPMRVAGFFFKSWRYTSRQVDSRGGERFRFAPMFVGREPLRILPPPEEPIWGWLAGFGFIGVVALLWIAGWRRSRSDQAFAASTLARLQRDMEPIDIDPADLPGDGE